MITEVIAPEHRQDGYGVRLEQGPTGADALDGCDVVVVVDVLSFTTTVTVSIERGIAVIPSGWRDDRAGEVAAAHGAVLAVGRLEARERPGLPSLSPAAMALVESGPGAVTRVVLPSPNGSTICRRLSESGAQVVAGCLRNAAAVGGWLADRAAAGAVVGVVAAGERWPDDTLRPAVEDLWGAGAVLAALLVHLPDADLSPEARAAVAAYDVVAGGLSGALAACASGRELVAAGFADDVAVAADLDAAAVVPVLVDGVFRDQVRA